jgi:shikimate kinase
VNVLYAQREPLYRQFADYMIENNTTVEDAAQQIAAYYQGG